MNEKSKKYWSIPIGCAFAFWGVFLNYAISENLLSWHYKSNWRVFYSPAVPTLFGFVLGIITSAVFFYGNTTVAIRSGFVFLFLTLLFMGFGLSFETPWLARLDTYGLCFVWSLSLIAIGYILRSRPKNHET